MISAQPDAGGHFGPYGGKYVPEVLMCPLEELERTYMEAKADPAFHAELDHLLRNYAGKQLHNNWQSGIQPHSILKPE